MGRTHHWGVRCDRGASAERGCAFRGYPLGPPTAHAGHTPCQAMAQSKSYRSGRRMLSARCASDHCRGRRCRIFTRSTVVVVDGGTRSVKSGLDLAHCVVDVVSSLIKRSTTTRTHLTTTPTIPCRDQSDTSSIFSSAALRTIPRTFSSNTVDATRRPDASRKLKPGRLVNGDVPGGGGRDRGRLAGQEDPGSLSFLSPQDQPTGGRAIAQVRGKIQEPESRDHRREDRRGTSPVA